MRRSGGCAARDARQHMYSVVDRNRHLLQSGHARGADLCFDRAPPMGHHDVRASGPGGAGPARRGREAARTPVAPATPFTRMSGRILQCRPMLEEPARPCSVNGTAALTGAHSMPRSCRMLVSSCHGHRAEFSSRFRGSSCRILRRCVAGSTCLRGTGRGDAVLVDFLPSARAATGQLLGTPSGPGRGSRSAPRPARYSGAQRGTQSRPAQLAMPAPKV